MTRLTCDRCGEEIGTSTAHAYYLNLRLSTQRGTQHLTAELCVICAPIVERKLCETLDVTVLNRGS